MKVLVATEKPFAAAAVNGIKAEIEAAGNQVVLLEKYTEKAQLLDAVKDADAMIIRSDKVDAEVLDAAKQLRLWFVQVQDMITSTSLLLPLTM